MMILGNFPVFGQASGLGYMYDMGWSNFSHSEPDYNQSIRTRIHNGFIRVHNNDGSNAVQILFGYRMDTVNFQNYSWYMASDGELKQFNTNAYLKRNAWRLGLINQMQFGKPGRIVLAINTGGFYEHTIGGSRIGYGDGNRYMLRSELNTHNLGIMLGAEIRLAWFTFGAKYEKLIKDVLDHDYILSQELSAENSSELRGLKMNPGMGFIYIGLNLDFF
jgi:hypothetical protein